MPQASGNVWHLLYVGGVQTPYFIDVACDRLHRSYGHRIGLWGAGLGRNGMAAFLGGFDRLTDAKVAAIQAMSATKQGDPIEHPDDLMVSQRTETDV
jgi:hypothetical protein